MRKINLRILVPAFLGVTMTVATFGQKKSEMNRGKPTEGFQVSAVAETPSIPRGHAVKVRITIKNVSRRTLYLAEVGPEKDYRAIHVSRGDGRPVPLTAHGRALMADTDLYANLSVQLEPGKERTDILQISDIFDMTAPGNYSISVSRRVGKLSGKGVEQAASNVVHVKVI
jgi:hypothetical protein